MRTPLNYTGNKSRLIDEFKDYFPKNVNVFVDLFCGGATVGLGIDAKKVYFIDNNKNVIELLKHLAKSNFKTIISRLEIIIETYSLSYSAKSGYSIYRAGVQKLDNNGLKVFNSEGFYKLRKYYNSLEDRYTEQALDLLYMLVVYGFNNDMRFNKKGEYNLPIGKTDLNNSNLRKLESYIERVGQKDCEFVCGDFRDESIREILFKADFIYADPPYLITNAVYNENGNWTEKEERDLLTLLDELNNKGKDVAFSNVLSRIDRRNDVLEEWIFKRGDFHINDIKYHYRSASYNKKVRHANEREVLITNFSYA